MGRDVGEALTAKADATAILEFLVGRRRMQTEAIDLADGCESSPERVNDAVTILEDSAYVEALRTMGAAPFDFYSLQLTPQGRHEWDGSRTRSSDSRALSTPPRA